MKTARDYATRLALHRRWIAWAACCSASLVVGRPATCHAYRTAVDLEEFSALSSTDGTDIKIGWQRSSVSFQLNTAAPTGLGVEDVARAVNVAMGTWNTPICSSLNFTLNGATNANAKPGDSTNTIQFVSDWQAAGFSPKVGAVTDVQYQEVTTPEGAKPRWVIAEVDIYLDAENHEWVFQVSNADDPRKSLLSVLTHELGHAAGLLHPCETERTRESSSSSASADTNAPLCGDVTGAEATLLYPEYAATQTELDQDDRAGLCFLYAQDSCETLGCSTGEVCTDHGCVRGCGGVVCAGTEQCVDEECVPLCDGLDCYVGQACSKTSDCKNFLKCRKRPKLSSRVEADEELSEKACLPGDTPLGDPCDSSRDCASMACTKAGFCADACVEDADCPTGTTCEKSLGAAKACVGAALGGLGEACDEANECWGNQCVRGRAATPVCTRECSLDAEDSATEPCPAGFECGTALTDGTQRTVCLPLVDASSCAMVTPAAVGATAPRRAGAAYRGLPLLGMFGALSLLVHFTRRARRRLESRSRF